jgi:hypothetical protein
VARLADARIFPQLELFNACRRIVIFRVQSRTQLIQTALWSHLSLPHDLDFFSVRLARGIVGHPFVITTTTKGGFMPSPKRNRSRNRNRSGNTATGQVRIILDASMPRAQWEKLSALIPQMTVQSLTVAQTRGGLAAITGGQIQERVA